MLNFFGRAIFSKRQDLKVCQQNENGGQEGLNWPVDYFIKTDKYRILEDYACIALQTIW